MKILKAFIRKYFVHFTYFYTHLRHRLFVTLGLSLLVAVLDGFGLAMFLPLLQVSDGDSTVDPAALGSLRFIIDGIKGVGIELTLTTVLITILVFFSLKGIVRFVEAFYKTTVRQYFIRKMRFDNVNKLTNMRYKAFVMTDSGRIQNTLTGEVARVAQAYQNYMTAVQDLVMILVYVVLAVSSNPSFALLVACGGLLSNQVYRKIYNSTQSASRKVSKFGHVFQGLLIQQVSYFKYLKATGLIYEFASRLREYITRIENNNKRIGYYASIMSATREPLVVGVVVGVILVQVSFFGQSVALIILSLMFFYRSLNHVMNMQTSWNNFLGVSGSLDNMTSFMKELNGHQEKFGTHQIAKFEKEIRLDSVSFSYGDQVVLKNLQFNIPRNRTIALVGESGSGKTTLVNLLAGLLPVEEGQMLIDDKSIRQIFVPSWQKRIGYITQEPVIFNDSIFNNVTLWAPATEVNIARFWKAMEQAAIAEFVRQLPAKEHSPLGIGGVLVSGGQKQRLSIARELFKDIDLLIMDEATSALDSETELLIQENIELLKGKYTILIIAHRLATVKNADRIILMNKGAIVADGDFGTLFELVPEFTKMVSLQDFSKTES